MTNIEENYAPNILMMAAGTGGHVFPALAVAKELEKRGANIHWLGTPTGMENDLVKPKGYQFHAIDMVGLRGKGISRLLKLPLTLANAILQTRKIIQQNQIDVVVGFGGYVTAPGGIAGKLLGKPLLIHEQNAIAGMSNRYLAKISNKVMQAFAYTFGEDNNRLITVGNPVREKITQITEPVKRFNPNKLIDTHNPLKLLVMGGSLGAKVLNDTVPQALELMDKPVRVHHQCGKDNFKSTEKNYTQVNRNIHDVTIMPFIDNMAKEFAWADVIVCRAGALTVSEVQNVGLPAIFVPLPHAVDDHQTANARHLSEVGASILLPQSELTAESLKDKLSSLDREVCLQMATKGKAQANPQSTKMVADIVCEFVNFNNQTNKTPIALIEEVANSTKNSNA